MDWGVDKCRFQWYTDPGMLEEEHSSSLISHGRAVDDWKAPEQDNKGVLVVLWVYLSSYFYYNEKTICSCYNAIITAMQFKPITWDKDLEMSLKILGDLKKKGLWDAMINEWLRFHQKNPFYYLNVSPKQKLY